MKRALVALVMSLMLLIPPPVVASNPFSRALQSVVVLETLVDDNVMKCSGSVIGRHILVAAHCVLPTNANVVVFNEDEDIAVVSAATGLPALELASGEPQLGQKAWILGFPGRGHEWPLVLSTTVAGVKSGYRDGAIRNLFHDGARPGMSGGPIIDERGRVIGMVSEAQGDGALIVASPLVKRIRELTWAYWEKK